MELINGTIGDNNYHLFEEVLTEVYAAFPHYISFVHKVNTHLASQYHVVKLNGKAVARCVSYNNENLIHKNSNPFVFGNFESINNQEVVDFLFYELKKIAQAKNKKNMIGPMSGSTWYDYRIAVPNDNPLFFTEFFTPPYYYELLHKVGFTCLAKYKSTHSKSFGVDERKLEQCNKLFHEKNVIARNLDLNNFESDLEHIFQVSLEGFKNNFLYSPITRKEFMRKYLPLKSLIDPATVFLVFDGEECVGFSMSLLNLLNKEKKQLVMKSAARLPGYKYKGLGTWFNELTKSGAKQRGYEELIPAFIIDDSISERTFSNSNDSVLYREYELLQMTV
jgi:hypothetical protein